MLFVLFEGFTNYLCLLDFPLPVATVSLYSENEVDRFVIGIEVDIFGNGIVVLPWQQ